MMASLGPKQDDLIKAKKGSDERASVNQSPPGLKSNACRANLIIISVAITTFILMFIGEYKHNIDNKGRLAVPAKFRSKLKKGAVVTKGLDNCLFLYPKEQWKKIASKLANLPVSQSKARAFSRLMLAGAMEVDFDNQGRINLPEYLRTFSSLKKKAVIAGLYDRLEIWDETKWERFKAGTEKQSSEIAETLGEMGV